MLNANKLLKKNETHRFYWVKEDSGNGYTGVHPLCLAGDSVLDSWTAESPLKAAQVRPVVGCVGNRPGLHLHLLVLLESPPTLSAGNSNSSSKNSSQ